MALALGTEFNECSIASAELSRRAHELFSEADIITPRELYVSDDVGFNRVALDTIQDSPAFGTPAGRHARA